MDGLENLLIYVLKKQPCTPSIFDASQIPAIYQALEKNNLAVIRCIIVNILNHFKKVFVKHFSKQSKEFIELFDLEILNEGAWGRVITFGGKSQPPFAIGKYLILAEGEGQFLIEKEIIIGLLLNTIHNEAPNFMYTYGGFLCSLKDRKDVRTLCQHDEYITFIGMFEYVTGKLFSDFKYNLSIEEQISILLQIMYSLHIAYQKFGFIHNDLHDENIIIKVSPEDQVVQLDSFSFTTKVIPIIIDYGIASVYFKDDNNTEHSIKRLSSDELLDIRNLLSYFPVSKLKNYVLDLCGKHKTILGLLEELKSVYKNPLKLDSVSETKNEGKRRKLEEEEEEEFFVEENTKSILLRQFISFQMAKNGLDLFEKFLHESQIPPKDIFAYICENLFGLNNLTVDCKFRIKMHFYMFFSKFLELNTIIRKELLLKYKIQISTLQDQIKFIFINLLQKECPHYTKKQIKDFLSLQRIQNFDSILENL
jgi:hypothetical protein